MGNRVAMKPRPETKLTIRMMVCVWYTIMCTLVSLVGVREKAIGTEYVSCMRPTIKMRFSRYD